MNKCGTCGRYANGICLLMDCETAATKDACPEYIEGKTQTCGECKHFSCSDEGQCMDDEWTFCDSDACDKFQSKVVTNGDVIRQMSNEELNIVIDCPYDGCIHPFDDYKCSECKLEWLNAPAESEGEDE